MTRRTTLALVREGIHRVRGAGFLVTWDVNSKDRPLVDRLYVFVWGKKVRAHGKEYVYPGFIDREGVRYLGQSVLFVRPNRLPELTTFLTQCGVDHIVDAATFV